MSASSSEAADNRPAAAFLLTLAVPVALVAGVALLRYPPADRALTALYLALVFAPIAIPPLVLLGGCLFKPRAVARRAARLSLALLTALAAAALLNGRLDRSPVREHVAHIHGKEVRSGRFARHMLLVDGWGEPALTRNRCELAICPSVFRTLAPGDDLAIYTRDGALGIPYVVALAPAER